MHGHRQCDVDGVDSWVSDGFFHRRPRASARVRPRFGSIACHEAVQIASRLGLNCCDHAPARDVAHTGQNPVNFAHPESPFSVPVRKGCGLQTIDFFHSPDRKPICRSASYVNLPDLGHARRSRGAGDVQDHRVDSLFARLGFVLVDRVLFGRRSSVAEIPFPGCDVSL